MSAAPGDTIMGEPTDVFVVDRVHFPELTRECPTITAALVHVMLDRARTFKSSELIDEKMVSLGHMSAHLAHELNNPASAVAWSAKLLSETLLEAENTCARLALPDSHRHSSRPSTVSASVAALRRHRR